MRSLPTLADLASHPERVSHEPSAGSAPSLLRLASRCASAAVLEIGPEPFSEPFPEPFSENPRTDGRIGADERAWFDFARVFPHGRNVAGRWAPNGRAFTGRRRVRRDAQEQAR
jgi:hypothetical protein